MKALILVAILALTVQAQRLVDADGVEWAYIGSGEKRATGEKFTIYARKLNRDSKRPALEVKVIGKSDGGLFRGVVDCKRGAWRQNGSDEWRKPTAGSVGKWVVKFACK